MKTLLRTFSAVTLAASALVWSGSASALWLGLADGDYTLTLTTCTNNTEPTTCAGIPITGQITVSGAGLSAMSITIDGVSFAGDPIDFIQDPFITPGDIRERSSLSNNSPFAFISLLHEIGTLGPNLPFTNAYIYCDTVANGCTPNTVGQWVATPNVVPEPSALALLALGFIGFGFARRRAR